MKELQRTPCMKDEAAIKMAPQTTVPQMAEIIVESSLDAAPVPGGTCRG
jgi:hypothetical protein